MSEMEARVAGISSGSWYDPHNRGTYSLLSRGDHELSFSRLTGNKKYTDKQTFTFSDVSASTCEVQGCSESQGFSVGDFSTNYCDLRMLYCGTAEGCKPVHTDFAISETSVKPSFGASSDPKACLAAGGSSDAEFLEVVQQEAEVSADEEVCGLCN